MAIDFKKTSYAGRFPEIWRGEAKILPGGFKPAQTFPVGTVVRRGTLVSVDFDTMQAAVIKTAKVLAGGDTTHVRIGKGHLFAVGDLILKVGKTDASPMVTAIDTANEEYDVLTLSAAIADIAADDIIAESTEYAAADGSNPAVPASVKYEPNFVIGSDKEFNGKGLPTLDVAYDCVVLYPSLQFPILPEWLTGACLKLNPNILFIKQ